MAACPACRRGARRTSREPRRDGSPSTRATGRTTARRCGRARGAPRPAPARRARQAPRRPEPGGGRWSPAGSTSSRWPRPPQRATAASVLRTWAGVPVALAPAGGSQAVTIATRGDGAGGLSARRRTRLRDGPGRGEPPARTSAGSDRSTTLPAATTVPAPMVTPFSTVTFMESQTPSSMTTGADGARAAGGRPASVEGCQSVSVMVQLAPQRTPRRWRCSGGADHGARHPDASPQHDERPLGAASRACRAGPGRPGWTSAPSGAPPAPSRIARAGEAPEHGEAEERQPAPARSPPAGQEPLGAVSRRSRKG